MPTKEFDWLPTPSQHFLVVTFALLVYVLTTRARREQRAPTTAIAWVMGLVLMPYFILPMYLLFGQRKLRPAGSPRPPRSVPPGHWAADLIESFGLAPPGPCAIRMHADGEAARQALMEVIDGARERIDVCTFIIGDDVLGHSVLERLAQRAREGIKVRVLLDGFGALSLPRHHFDRLRSAGGEVAVFRPFFSLRRMGPRNLRNRRPGSISPSTCAAAWRPPRRASSTTTGPRCAAASPAPSPRPTRKALAAPWPSSCRAAPTRRRTRRMRC